MVAPALAGIIATGRRRRGITHSVEISVHFAATWFMTGAAWVIQLVHYPMFARFDRASFRAGHAEHSRRITWIVAPAMFVELITALLLWSRLRNTAASAGVILVIAIWAVTAFAAIPAHERLGRGGYDPAVLRRLLRWHWVRTAAWSARAILISAWL